MIFTSHKTWHLTTKRGSLGKLHRNFVSDAGLEHPNRGELASAFTTRVQWLETAHVWYLVAFQLAMLLIDWIVFDMKIRWVIWYQFAWLGFGAVLLQVRPSILYAVLLSQMLIDGYIRDLLQIRKDRRWLDWAAKHRELELKIFELWKEMNGLVFLPCAPFLVFAALHIVSDSNLVRGSFTALFLTVLAAITLNSVLSPIASISTMFSSPSAYRGILTEKTGRMSIAAVVRSLVDEPSRSSEEDQRYGIFLQYVQGSKIRVMVGIPHVCMVGIDSQFVARFLWGSAVKFPFVVSVVLAIRNSL